ncbi:YtpI family protein [Desmospora activa]|uniref:YtpI-like protein n=1 Tax=Desmospora activa DSM 45169 TaxID=1121389 RepID=A0A2T4Z860_9BACL|nr:YtpI family protein [Desmospora activa]PTM58060.1 YtpI-like protein [Desmospora activa DSM 45169]
MEYLLIILIGVILFAAIRTFSNSMASRRSEGVDRAKHRAQMNINMGVLFIAIAVLQGISVNGSGISLFLLLLIGAIGLYNFIHGVRTWQSIQKNG